MIKIETWGTLDALAERADFLDGFFKVIMKLVDKQKYPVFFNDFYLNGDVPTEKLDSLLKEINKIEALLKNEPINENFIANEPDFAKVDNYKDFLDGTADNMADFFLTPNKENMFETFKFNIEYAIKKKAPVYIKYYIV